MREQGLVLGLLRFDFVIVIVDDDYVGGILVGICRRRGSVSATTLARAVIEEDGFARRVAGRVLLRGSVEDDDVGVVGGCGGRAIRRRRGGQDWGRVLVDQDDVGVKGACPCGGSRVRVPGGSVFEMPNHCG